MSDAMTTLRRQFLADRVGSLLMTQEDGRQMIELGTFLPEEGDDETAAAIAAVVGDGIVDRCSVEVGIDQGAVWLVFDAPAEAAA